MMPQKWNPPKLQKTQFCQKSTIYFQVEVIPKHDRDNYVDVDSDDVDTTDVNDVDDRNQQK